MKYRRSLYPHWGASPDPKFDDVRQYMIAKSVVSGLVLDEGRVIGGLWHCFYTGRLYSIDEHTPDLDHVIPLKAAHIRGAGGWSPSKRKQFANDPDNLVVVFAGSNRQKSAMVSKWLPPNIANGADYVQRMLKVINKYGLVPTANDKKTYLFLNSKISMWQKGIRLDPVKAWFKKTFVWEDE